MHTYIYDTFEALPYVLECNKWDTNYLKSSKHTTNYYDRFNFWYDNMTFILIIIFKSSQNVKSV